MKIFLLVLSLGLCGCTIINAKVYPPATAGQVTITINTDRTVTTTPSIKADGNTVPVSALP